jgi:hypothetical protein
MDRQTDRHLNRFTEREREVWTDRQINRLTDSPTDERV